MKITYLVFSFLLAGGLLSCNKFTMSDPKGPPNGSDIVYFPVITRTGPEYLSVVKGTTYTDPGVKAAVNGKDVPVTVSGTVNTGQVGWYILIYTAANKDGYTASTQRNVFVIPSAEAPGTDLSGTYAPVGGTAPANAVITKIDQGLYYTTNCWGGGSVVVLPVYFICSDGATLVIPEQVSGPYGRVATVSPGSYVAGLITWTVSREDFPGGALTVTKKWQKQ